MNLILELFVSWNSSVDFYAMIVFHGLDCRFVKEGCMTNFIWNRCSVYFVLNYCNLKTKDLILDKNPKAFEHVICQTPMQDLPKVILLSL